MSNPGLYKDLSKKASDLLTRDFPSEEKKVEWKGVTANAVTIETKFEQKGDAVVGTITPSYKLKQYGTTFLAEFNTKKDIKLETAVENQMVDGLKVILTAEAKGKESYGTLATEYRHPRGTFTASIDYGKAAGQTAKASTLIGINQCFVGLSTEYQIGQTSELKNFNASIGYKPSDFEAVLFGRTSGDKNEVGGSFFHNVSADTQVGGEAIFDTSSSDAKPKLAFCGQHKLNPDTTLKAKVDTSGMINFSINQILNKAAKFTVGAKLDTKNSNQATFGFSFNFTS